MGKFAVALIFLLICSVASFVYEVKCIDVSISIIIKADGSIDPPTAPISTVDNVTYVLTSDINNQSISVQRNNTAIDGRGHMLQGSYVNFSYGLNLSNVTNVTVENMGIEAFWYGIFVDSCSDHRILGNNITNNVDAIFLQSSANDSVSGNNITNNNGWGVVFFDSNNETLFRNNITNNHDGVTLGPSSNDDISENNVANNTEDGIMLYGIFNQTAFKSSTTGNIITNNDVKNNKVDGIKLVSSTSNTISGNNVTNNGYGIWLESSSRHNTISENNITNNYYNGISLYSSNNIVSGNNILNNGFGISVIGLSLSNSIFGNTILNNGCGIISMNNSANNLIFHNNFINNTIQVSSSGSTDFWDNGQEGNYWSDYNGTDANQDGIGDTPYIIEENNTDRYPLMAQYVIPEFPSFLFLPIFFIAILLASIVYRRKHFYSAER